MAMKLEGTAELKHQNPKRASGDPDLVVKARAIADTPAVHDLFIRLKDGAPKITGLRVVAGGLEVDVVIQAPERERGSKAVAGPPAKPIALVEEAVADDDAVADKAEAKGAGAR